jgi:Fe2+ or Zn2+ uptake regulation protein
VKRRVSPYRDRVLRTLRRMQQPASAREVADRMDPHCRDSVGSALAQLAALGEIEQVPASPSDFVRHAIKWRYRVKSVEDDGAALAQKGDRELA